MPVSPRVGAVLMASLIAVSGLGFARAEPSALDVKPAEQAPPDADKADARFFRVLDGREDAGTSLKDRPGVALSVQSGLHVYEPISGAGPTITLAPAIHIAEKAFYAKLQERLDAMDVVLFEGVKPDGAGRTEHDLGNDDAQARIDRTNRRMRLLAVAAWMFKNQTGALPKDLPTLLAGADERLRQYLAVATTDAWGGVFEYRVEVTPPVATEPAKAGDTALDQPATAPDSAPDSAPETKPQPTARLEIISLGADGKPDGEGENADLRLSDQPPMRRGEVPSSGASQRGLQQQLASALGLVFQLDVMDHQKPHWRNSDLSLDQLQQRMGAGDSSALVSMLEGSSIQAKIARFILGLIRVVPAARTMGRVALAEAITRADELLNVAGGAGLDEHAMNVILHDRNAVVIDDLKRIVRDEPGVKTIGIIYGGGHMPGIEPEVLAMGYRLARIDWLEAISVPVQGSGMTSEQIRQIRTSVGKSLDEQVRAAQRLKDRRAAPSTPKPAETE